MSDTHVSFPKPCDQDWDRMEQRGQHRRCEACEQTIFDLEKLTFEEAQALLNGATEACVRAKVAPDGSVALAKSARGEHRAFKAAIGAAASLAVAACAGLGGDKVSPRFTVEGSVEPWQRSDQLVLEGEGRRYKTRAKNDSSFQFTNLKPGTYRLTAMGYCGEPKDLGEFVLKVDDVDIGKVEYQEDCIIVGQITREDPKPLG